jgi:hypothetical protein
LEVGRGWGETCAGLIGPESTSMTMIRVVADCTLPYRGRCALPFYGLYFCWHFRFELNLRLALPHYKRNLRL